MSTLFIIDIDATIADATERIKRAGTEPLRHNKEVYDAWVALVNSGMEDDRPVPGMVELTNSLGSDSLVYLTSREVKHAATTASWLKKNGFPQGPLFMRPDGNYQETHEFKIQVIEELQDNFYTIVVVDDDESGRLEQLCKERGYTFLKARSGGQR